jgi:hypothetical protein
VAAKKKPRKCEHGRPKRCRKEATASKAGRGTEARTAARAFLTPGGRRGSLEGGGSGRLVKKKTHLQNLQKKRPSNAFERETGKWAGSAELGELSSLSALNRGI